MSDQLAPELRERIQSLVDTNPVMLFMKGNKHFPRCGFSATVIEVLKRVGVPFATEDILQDQDLRSGIKIYANWPTIPQLYIAGEFVGGCDIVRAMYESGELETLVREKLGPADES
jgi:monothiol glutaredoxin